MLSLTSLNTNGGVGGLDHGFGRTQAAVHLDRLVLDGLVKIMGSSHSHEGPVDAIWKAIKEAVGSEESQDWVLEKYVVDQKMNCGRGTTSGVTKVRILAGPERNKRQRFWGESLVSDTNVAAALAMLNAINRFLALSDSEKRTEPVVV